MIAVLMVVCRARAKRNPRALSCLPSSIFKSLVQLAKLHHDRRNVYLKVCKQDAYLGNVTHCHCTLVSTPPWPHQSNHTDEVDSVCIKPNSIEEGGGMRCDRKGGRTSRNIARRRNMLP